MGAGMSTELGERSLVEENRNELEEARLRLVHGDSSFTNVDLANRYIGDEGLIQNIPSCLMNNHNITRLDLSFNGLTERSVPPLIAAIKTCPQLRILDLAGNKIGEEGCKGIANDYLAENPELEELYLFHNGLYDKAIVPFANALLRNNNLAVLNLDQNSLTNASWVMLHTAIVRGSTDANGAPLNNGNKGLVRLKVGLRSDVVPSEALLEEVAVALKENGVGYSAKKAAEQKAAKASEEQARQQVEAEKEAILRAEEEERARAAYEAAEEQRRREEEAEMLAYEAEAEQQQQHGSSRKSKEQAQSDNERWVARAMDQAYEWRNKLTQNGTVVKEWKDGFSTLTTKPGDELGSKPSATDAAPRRLKACWCDPHDVSVPYAKTLHYHCKHEDLNRPLQEGQVPKYDGCYASGHVCASVGFYAQPKPDKSAAHFFASPPRAAREDGNDVFEDGNLTHMSHFTRSQTAANSTTSTIAPAAIAASPH